MHGVVHKACRLISLGGTSNADECLTACYASSGLQREYDTEGALLEVRSRTAILGNWAGGRM